MEMSQISKILLYLLAAFFILGIAKFIYQLFNGNGPVSKGTGDLLGAGANLINGIVNGCQKQPDCTKGSNTDSTECSSLVNCSLQTVLTKNGDKTNICTSNNGTPPGGGINTMGCALGIGFLAYLAASILAPIAGFFIKIFSKTNKTVSDISEVTGKDIATVTNEVATDAISTGEKVKNQLESEGETVSDTRAERLGKSSASATVYKKLHDSVPNPNEAQAKKLTEAAERQSAESKHIVDEAVENGENKEDAESDIDTVHDNVEPEVVMKMYQLLDAIHLSKSDISETLQKHLIRKIDRHSINIHKKEHKDLLFAPMLTSCNTSIDLDNCDKIRNQINTLFSKYDDDSDEGNCFKCQNDGTVTNGKLPDDVFTPKALEWSRGKTFSVDCSKDNWNCSDMLSEYGEKVPYSTVKNCACSGNGICSNTRGASICECNPNWKVNGSCSGCEDGYEKSGDKCTKVSLNYSCKQSINSDRSMTRKCEEDSTGKFANKEECEKECVGKNSVDCNIGTDNEWCGVCANAVFTSNCDYVCSTRGRKAASNIGTPGGYAKMVIKDDTRTKTYTATSGGSCWMYACACYPKDLN